MNPDLWALGLAAVIGLVSAFVAYWFGVSAAERRARAMVERSRAREQAHAETSLALARQLYAIKRERQIFEEITANWKEN